MANIRAGNVNDLEFLDELLFEAFFWDPAIERPSRSAFCRHSEFMKLLADWGRQGDQAMIAEEEGVRMGAAWYRLWREEVHSYGFVDAATPEIAMAVKAEFRGKGVGRLLLEALILQARQDGFRAVSLSVDPQNPARRLYESAGFRRVGQSGTSLTLMLHLRPVATSHCADQRRWGQVCIS
jgi:ribosomal protein S18 acetylase RimI-like enzyme